MLDAVDVVAFLDGGRVVASGTHRELLDDCPAYRRVVIRETDFEAPDHEPEAVR
jgi:ABC-type multidrug transport system fused ATPase/permease subunit